jgi:hypothetical protein
VLKVNPFTNVLEKKQCADSKKRQNSETIKQQVKEKWRNKKLRTGKGNTWLGQKRKRCGSFAESHSLRTGWIVCLRCLKWAHGNCAQFEGLADNCASYCCLCPTWASADFKRLEGLTFFVRNIQPKLNKANQIYYSGPFAIQVAVSCLCVTILFLNDMTVHVC